MKITNNLNLPTPFLQAVEIDRSYTENEYRVTSLLKGIRETILERRHHNEIEQDVADMIWLIFGTAVHSILEQSQEADHEFKEERLKVAIGEYVLSGQFDLYDTNTGIVKDYKTCSVWKLVFGDFHDWRKQLLIYGWMLRKTGFEVKGGQIVALLKDHSKRDAKFKADYPKYPVETVSFRFTEEDFMEIEEFLFSKFNEIKECEQMSDDVLPICTMEERYNSGNKYAVMKNGRKTALRVLDTMQDAEEWKKANSGDSIEIREGEDKKCIDYCAVAPFCSYAKARGYV